MRILLTHILFLFLLPIISCRNDGLSTCNELTIRYKHIRTSIANQSVDGNTLTALKRLSSKGKKCINASILLGDYFFRQKLIDTAIQYYRNANLADSGNVYVNFQLADLNICQENYGLALEYLLRAERHKIGSDQYVLTYTESGSEVTRTPSFDIDYDLLQLKLGIVRYYLRDLVPSVLGLGYCISKEKFLGTAYYFRFLAYKTAGLLEKAQSDSLNASLLGYVRPTLCETK